MSQLAALVVDVLLCHSAILCQKKRGNSVNFRGQSECFIRALREYVELNETCPHFSEAVEISNGMSSPRDEKEKHI